MRGETRAKSQHVEKIVVWKLPAMSLSECRQVRRRCPQDAGGWSVTSRISPVA